MKILICVIACLVLAVGCSTSPESAAPITSVSAARARWAEGGPGDYRFDFHRQCFCLPEAVQPVTVEVRGGTIASVLARETGQPVGETPNIEWYSIEDLFRLIEEAEADGQQVEVEYSPDGYPRRILIGSLAADAGIEYHVENVTPL